MDDSPTIILTDHQSTLDESFLANAIQLLDKAHLNPELISGSLSGRHEIHLAAVLVAVFLEFLKGVFISSNEYT